MAGRSGDLACAFGPEVVRAERPGDDAVVLRPFAGPPGSIAQALLHALPKAVSWDATLHELRLATRWLASHTGLPVIVVAALALLVGWRVLRRTARFLVQIAVVASLLAGAEAMGWIRW